MQEHVVQFIDYFEGEQQSVILTEYLEGGELFQRISSPDYNLTEAKCRDFTRQILKAVDFIHSRRIIHLDLKPQNIVLCRKPSKAANGSAAQENANLSKELKCCDELKIIDFGLARALGKLKKNFKKFYKVHLPKDSKKTFLFFLTKLSRHSFCW